jgi:hypothetical protein
MDPDSGVLLQFYRDLVWALDEHARKGRTAIGAASVAKRVARVYLGEAVERVPLPRWNRSEVAARAWARGSGTVDSGSDDERRSARMDGLERIRALLQARGEIDQAISQGIANLAADGVPRTELAEALGVHRATLYRKYDVGGALPALRRSTARRNGVTSNRDHIGRSTDVEGETAG